MGDAAEMGFLEQVGADVVVDGRGASRDRFDAVGLIPDESGSPQTLVVVEGKGSTARLSFTGRETGNGIRAAQGSTAYFDDVFLEDRVLQDYLSSHPEIATAVSAGEVDVRYVLVEARLNGTTRVSELLLDYDKLTLATGVDTVSG